MGNFESQLEGLISWALSFTGPTTHHMVFQLPLFSLFKICKIIFSFLHNYHPKVYKSLQLYRDQRIFIHIVYNFLNILQWRRDIFPLGYDDNAYPFHFPDPWVKKENSQLDLFTFTDHLDNGKNCQRYVTTYYLLQGVLWSQAM